MPIKPQPATVQDVDHDDHPILHKTKSAARIAKSNSTSPISQRRRTPYVYLPKKPTEVIYGETSSSMPIYEMAQIYQTYRKNVAMTIYTRSQDRSLERNEVPGCKFRKIFGTGK